MCCIWDDHLPVDSVIFPPLMRLSFLAFAISSLLVICFPNEDDLSFARWLARLKVLWEQQLLMDQVEVYSSLGKDFRLVPSLLLIVEVVADKVWRVKG
ncbi:hypothetical protein Nepgr_004478 [Nepenthes gracilis]|uniref:Uncharacterized protein n=1 Tax=Nepenthes gracilis TaxID=150966 RepID=A0AAD3XF66_NEPGR|nr:hypothetical protein Nepgr_004478 [Nepenthes gracilis]